VTTWRKLAYLLPWRRRAAERDMADELRALAEMAEPGELGNLTRVAEDARAEWGWTWLEQTVQDIRYAWRSLAAQPGFTATAVLSLALGIGANTALFTLVNTVMWKMLPISDPEHLLLLGQRGRTFVSNGFTYQQYQSIRDQNQVMDLAAYSRVPLNITIDGHVEPTIDGQLVSGNYFGLLGVRAQRGRLIEPADDLVPMGQAVAVISDSYWKSRFARDPGIVGRQVSLSGVPFTIVGVAPQEFFGVEVGSAPKLFVPVMMQPVVMPVTENLLDNPGQFLTWLRVVGRLKTDVSPAQASARLDALAQDAEWRPRNKLTGQFEELHLMLSTAATGLSDLRTQFSLPFQILVGVVAIVLLVACANTGTLVLARGATRRPEFALRLALGAGRSRLIRQVLVEGLMLAGLAGISGVVLAYWATHALVAYASAGRNAISLDLSPDLRVLAFTAAVSVIAGLLFATVPSIRASRFDMTSAARYDLARTRTTLGGSAPGKALVVCQVAFSLILVAGAGVFLRSLQNLNRQETDVEPTQVLILRVEPRGSDQRNILGATERLDRTYRDLLERVERIPGVQTASLARSTPLAPIGFAATVTFPSGDAATVQDLMVYPHYFGAMGLRLVQGRDFNDDDLRPDSRPVAIVNEAFVREVMKGRAPLGTSHGLTMAIRRTPPARGGDAPVDIVGVASDSPYPNLREATVPTIYQTFLQTPTGRGQMVLHVRTTGNADATAREIRDVVQAIDPAVPMFEIHTLKDEVDASLVRERLTASLSGFFGAVALALVSVGLYGLMAFTVARRTPEIGVRVVLGATRSDVRWLIMRQTMGLAAVGITIGLPVAWLIGRLAAHQLSGLLFELTPSDPTTLTIATVVLVVVSACAGVLPARRATRIDPIVALRNE
jgi:predicted permease